MIKNTNLAHHYDLWTSDGIPFRVLLETDTKDHKGDPVGMVEFYDLRWRRNYGTNGQFVSRCSLPPMLDGRGGIDLTGGNRSWTIGARDMNNLRAWLHTMRDAANT